MALRLLALFALLCGGLLLNLCLGEINLSPQDALQALMSGMGATPSPVETVLWQIRLPRLITAALVGSALAVSGYLLQTLSRNYLADPYLTGVSSGAALMVALVAFFNLGFTALPLVALVGGLVAALVVAVLARTPYGLSVTRLLLGGVAISAVCGSLITLVITSSTNGRAQGLFFWLGGSICGRTWSELTPAAICIAVAIAAALLLSKPLRLLGLGAENAASLGLAVPAAQWAVLLVAVGLCGTAVSLSGLVGFVGLVAPYLARVSLGNDERLHILGSAIIGALLVALSDLGARTLAHGQELPLGTLLSLIGAPFFLWLIMRHREEVV